MNIELFSVFRVVIPAELQILKALDLGELAGRLVGGLYLWRGGLKALVDRLADLLRGSRTLLRHQRANNGARGRAG